jgi:predicted nucleic acid-binding Zn ribbon protein
MITARVLISEECEIKYEEMQRTENLLMVMVICVAISQVAIIVMMALGVLPGMPGRKSTILISKFPTKKPFSHV